MAQSSQALLQSYSALIWIPTLNHPSTPHMQDDNHASSDSGGTSTPWMIGMARVYDVEDGKSRGRYCLSAPIIVWAVPSSSVSRVHFVIRGDWTSVWTRGDRLTIRE